MSAGEDECREPMNDREELVAAICDAGQILASPFYQAPPADRLDDLDLAEIERLIRAVRSVPISNPVGAEELSPAEISDMGFLLEVNRRVLHPAGAAMFVEEESGRVGVWMLDYFDDPEGVFFGRIDDPEDLEDVRQKWGTYDFEVRRRSPARLEAGREGPETIAHDGARVETRGSIDPSWRVAREMS